MNTLSILLENFPQYFNVDTLLSVYSTSKLNKYILDNPYVLKLVLSGYKLKIPILLTFKSFVETANRGFLGNGCFNYYTHQKCAEEAAKRGDLDTIKLAFSLNALKLEHNNDWKQNMKNIGDWKANLQLLDDYCKTKDSKDSWIVNMDRLDFACSLAKISAGNGRVDVFLFSKDKIEQLYDITNGHITQEQKIRNLRVLWNIIILAAAKGGNKAIFNTSFAELKKNGLFQYKFEHEWSYVIYYAAKGGNPNILNKILEEFNIQIVDNASSKVFILSSMVRGYAASGNTELLKNALDALVVINKAISKDLWNKIILNAVKGGHTYIALNAIDTIKREYGNNSINWCSVSQNAARKGNMDILKLFVSSTSKIPEFRNRLWPNIMSFAARGNDTDVINFVLAQETDEFKFNWKDIVNQALLTNNLDLLKLSVVSKGARGWNLTLTQVIDHKFLCNIANGKMGQIFWTCHSICETAIMGGSLDIIEFIQKYDFCSYFKPEIDEAAREYSTYLSNLRDDC